ncbi:MAG: ribonuclease HII [Halobacteriaceae archaeon]
MEQVAGTDEAGKGPVLGSMFAGCVRAAPERLPDGVADSKRLAPERREQLAARLRADDGVAVSVAEIPVERIDDPETDMNGLTLAAHAAALAPLADDGLLVRADAGDTDEARFGRRLADRVDPSVTVRAEHGADDEHAAVAAASIVAKVARDAHVGAIGERYAADVGSGYPSDPDTRAFLAEYVDANGELPDCARESWATCDDVLAAAEQSDLGDF